MKSNPSQDPLQRDIREQRKGKVTFSPKGKAKVKARARKKHPGKGNHNQDQTGSPNEDGQRTLGDLV